MPIAIVGAACRLPGAPDLDAFAALLMAGRDAVTEVPEGRFNQERFLHPRPGETARAPHFRAGVIGDVAGFDAPAFGLSPREADEMDPQQRLLLTLARRAFEDAGWPEERAAGQEIGVYVGASTTDYADLRQQDHGSSDRYIMSGGALSIASNRIGHVFDLRGPAMTLDTACSSSLVALHSACEALRAGQIPAAVVGGVNMLLSPFPFGGFWRAGMLSLRGRCQAFGAGADGYVRAEGGVVLILKPLDAALRDGDAVRGVILASGVNASGRTSGISLPNGAAQSELIGRVLRDARLPPAALGYFEAHGTGTPAGDPIEAGAIARAVAPERGGRGAPLPIGSVKSNIGHTEAASGLVGVLKALVVLETGRIPPTLHAETPNPAIPFAEYGLLPATRALPFEGEAVAVNSFGFGGTNACVALAAGPTRATAPGTSGEAPPLLLTARGPEQLAALATAWEARLRGLAPAPTAALIRAQARHRDLLPHRLVLRGIRRGDDAADALRAHLEGAAPAGVASGVAGPGRGVAFVFSGNGAQWAGMARAELRSSKAFRAGIERADAALRPHLGWSVLARLRRGVTAEALADTGQAQPLLFAIQHAIVGALAAQGITPALCIGHSVGEVAAAEAAGLLSLNQAARLIAVRSRAQARTRGQGRMAALGATPAEAAPLLAECSAPGEPPLEIAAINAPAALTIAGPAAALERLGEAARAARFSWLPLDLDYAFHSAAMEPVRAELLDGLRGLRQKPGQVPMLSSVTGAALPEGACRPAYWWRNLREPVRFAAAVKAALDAPLAERPAVFLEIGPHAVLQGYLRACVKAAGSEAEILPTLRRPAADGATAVADPFPLIADRATACGADPRGAPAFTAPGTAAWRGLPPGPLAPRHHWFPRSPEATGFLDAPRDGRLLGFRHYGTEAGEEWRRTIDTLEEPWLADHALAGHAVLPAAAMLEMALEAGFTRHRQATAIEIADFGILRPLPLSAETAREIRCRLDAEGLFTLEARRRLVEEGWTLHARGRVTFIPVLPEPAPLALDGDWREGGEITALAARQGLDYGPAFRPVTHWRADAEAGQVEALLERPAPAPEDAAFHLHPVRLDGAMQALLALLGGAEGDAAFTHLPVRFARMAVRRGATFPIRAEARIEAPGQRGITAGLTLRDGAGVAQAVLTGALFQRVPRLALPGMPGAMQDAALAFHTAWHPAPLPTGWPAPPHALDIAALEAPVAPGPSLQDAALLLAAHGVAMSMEAGAALFEGPLAEALRTRAHALELDHAALPPPGAIWQQVLFDQPSLAQELAVLAEAAESLPAALAGLPMPPAVLPPHAESFSRLAEALAASAATLLETWPAGRPCRVLLVGAEDGPLLPALQRGLASLGDALRLTVTHLPGGRPPPVPAGAELFDWDPASDVPAPAEGDLVLALALSPRCGASPRMAENLRAATAPGGVLLLAEPMPGLFWDMTEGLAPAWWSAPRLRDPAGWEAVLSAGGWPQSRQILLAPLPWEAALVAAAKPAGGVLLNAAPARRFAIWAGAGQQPWAEALGEALAAAGAQVQHLPATPAARALRGTCLIALPGDTPGCGAALGHLAALADGAATQFHLVLRDATLAPAAAGHLAMARVLVNEMATLRPLRHDLAADLTPPEAARRLAATLLTPPGPNAEGEERLTASARLVPRLEMLPLPTAAGLPPGDPAQVIPGQLEVGVPGQLGTLGWRPAPELLAAPGEGEVVLRVAAAGLNFRDLMWAQNLLPEEALQPGFAGPGLGMEAAGIIEAVGAGVALRPGQAVFGFARRALASRAITHAAALAPLPRGCGMVEAASLPVAFLTAIHSLEGLARLQPGERVLIHGGAGAVGLAALQVALAAGARVAVTAGTEARRAFLRAAGAEVALNSRDTSFAEALRAHWPAPPGEGCVDVCLNSLSGEAMERSLQLMAPFGRFLELGKRDFAESRRVAMRPLRRNVAWFAVDLDEVARHRPAMAARLLASLATRLEDGAIRPLPTRRYPAELAEEAFRQLQAGGHIGKLVITPPEERPLLAGRDWRPQGTVVVIGGAAGFGLEAACWLAGQGVRHLALVSRRGAATPGAAEALARLAALGAQARILAADATDEAALAAALDLIRAEMPPIGGVVQAAAVFADGISARLETAAVEAVWAAKAGVAAHLDRLTRQDALRMFLLFSSATVPIGSPGQAAYVAANAAMEAIARRRHADGLPALAVQWGPISDAGILAQDPSGAAGLSQRLGARAMTAAAALAQLPRLLEAGLPVLGLAQVDWNAAQRRLRLLAEPAFAALTGGGGASEPAEEDLLRAIAEAGPDAGLEIAQRVIGREVARILRLPTSAVAPDAPLQRLGLDSLGSIELRTGLERRFAATIPLETTTEELTVNALARAVLAQISVSREAAE